MNTHTLPIGIAAAVLAASCGNGSGSDPGATPCAGDSPATSGLVINELMAANTLTLRDASGNSFDWIELHNTTGADISLCGWRLTTRLDDPEGFRIDNKMVVPAGGQLLLLFTGDEEPPGAGRVPLVLAREGGELALLAPDGTFADRLIFGAQAVDLSAAREPDGGADWMISWHVSPGAPNSSEAPETPVAEDVSAPPEMVPAAGDISEVIMGFDELPEIELRIDDEGIAALERQPYQYVPGSIVYDGREYGPVGIRLKGQNSFQPIHAKPSFRVNVDEFIGGASFYGLDDLTLNNMDDDPSMMHERLAYLVARQMGPASRANHALVTLNGTYYGLYVNVETVKWHMIARWFDDPTGPLYEGTDVDFRAELIDLFEHESGTDDRSVLFSLAAALEHPDPDAALAGAAEYVNMESFWQYWALCAIVAQFDAFPYSLPGDDYFIYIDPTTAKVNFVPWGMDETFLSADFDVSKISSVLAEHCLASDSCYQGLVDRLWGALDMLDEIDLATERARVEFQITPYVDMDPRRPYDDATVTEYQTQLRYFIEGRRATLSMQLPPPSR